MLKQRIITALILVALVLIALFAPNPIYWRALISLAILISFFEWLKLCKVDSSGVKVLAYSAFAVCFYLLQAKYVAFSVLVPLACLLWVVLLIFTLSNKLDVLHNRWSKLLIGILVLSVAGSLIIEFKSLPNGALWVLCFMVSIWAADVGAYFSGKRFGKTKLAPTVSPGKTIEGLVGGLALVALFYTPLLFWIFAPKAAAMLLVAVLLTALISVGGDLFESKLKRHAGLKDSSQILPGHGGMLDRIDSLLAGAPFFSGGLLLLGHLA